MDNSSQSILETLRTVEFRLGLKGYNVDEVDEYLEKAAVEAETVLEQLRTANERLRNATERASQLEAELQRAPGERTPEPAPVVQDDALQRTLLLAQKFVDQTKRESEAEAAEVVSRAEERARTVVAQAEDRARQIVTESEQRLRDEVSRLEATRSRLANEADGLAKHVEEQRARIRESLSDALKWFDDHVPTGTPTPEGGERTSGGAAPEGGRPSQPERGAAPPSQPERGAAPPSQPVGSGADAPAGAPAPAVAGAASAGTGSPRAEATTRANAAQRGAVAGDLFGGHPRSD